MYILKYYLQPYIVRWRHDWQIVNTEYEIGDKNRNKRRSQILFPKFFILHDGDNHKEVEYCSHNAKQCKDCSGKTSFSFRVDRRGFARRSRGCFICIIQCPPTLIIVPIWINPNLKSFMSFSNPRFQFIEDKWPRSWTSEKVHFI